MKKLKISQLLLVIGLIGSSAMASAQIDPWTAVGSTGTVDDADISILDTAGTVVQVKSTAPLPASLRIRYNIVAVDGVFSPADGVRMVARFRDNGAAARVRVRLLEIPFSTGIPALKLTLDSNSFTAASGFQTQSVGSCDGNFFKLSQQRLFCHCHA
jgi:hypothetical protein